MPGYQSADEFADKEKGWTGVHQWEKEMAKADEKYGPIFAKFAAMPIEEVAKDPQAVKMGGRLFASNCSICHGSDAKGRLRLPQPDRRRLALGRRAGNHQDHHHGWPPRRHAGLG